MQNYFILVGISKTDSVGYELILGSYDKRELKQEVEYIKDAYKKMKVLEIEDSEEALIMTLTVLNASM